jgi:hypothetical protein
MTDATINSDYFFLENVLQTVDGGKRLLKQVGAIAGGGTHSLVAEVDTGDNDNDDEPTRKRQKTIVEHLPPKWRRLVQQAREREVTLLLMPQGMERHKSNTSHFNTKSERIIWKLEFSIHGDATPPNKMIVSNKVSEESKFIEEWNKHTQNMEIQQDLHFMLKKLPCPANKPQYVELNKESTLGDALKGMTVIEFPTIYVVLATELHNFPRLIQEVN